MNPSGNLTDAIIVAGFGVGEGVVSDQVESDAYAINRQSGNVSKTIRKKQFAISYSEGKGMLKSPVDPNLMDAPCLSDEEINLVNDVLFKAEKLLNTVADIEFCLDESGELFLLQARPLIE